MNSIKPWSEKLEEAWAQFGVFQLELVEYSGEVDYVDPEPEYIEYENKYFKAHSALTDAIRERKDALVSTSVVNSPNQNNVCSDKDRHGFINLPNFSIPIFAGDYKDWPGFKDLFIGSVDRNTSLTGTQKFQYLKSFLRGDAASLIKHMSSSEQNYLEAWERLERRYDRKQVIVQSFVQAFLSLPSTTGNLQTLRKIAEGADEVVRGLNTLDSSGRDPWLIFLLLQKVDADTKQAWAAEVGSRDDSTIDDLIEFLLTRCDCLESCSSLSRPVQPRIKNQTPIRTHYVEKNSSCPKCNNLNHTLSNCSEFASLDTETRRKFVKEHSVCFNCLRPGHVSNKCRSNFRCRVCNSKHHSLVHPTNDKSPSSVNRGITSNDSLPPSPSLHDSSNPSLIVNHSLESNHQSCAILPTSIARIQDKQGSCQNVRLLLDSESQVSLITEQTVQRLGLMRKPKRIPVSGIASTSVGTTNGLVSIRLMSCYNSEVVEVECYVMSKITSLIPSHSIASIAPNIFSFQLADPHFNKPGHIDILIGADKIFNIIRGPAKEVSQGCPSMVPTVFGWVVTGTTFRNTSEREVNSFCTKLDLDQEFNLERFWHIEEVHVEPTLTIAEQRAEDHFSTTYSRSSDGRYVVELPFKHSDSVDYGNSFDLAARNRFLAIERRFKSNPKLHQEYSNFINEYISLGHMEEVPEEEILQPTTKCFYLPHHAVFKVDSSTTKIRVVFDGSASATNSKSLNDSLLIGPTIQSDIFSICMRFRRHAYTISGDIEKMYRQIWVARKHVDYQRIIWRISPELPLKHFRLLTVTYGTSCAPFLAIRTLKQLAVDNLEKYPRASRVVLDDFYVDDVITGTDSIESIIALQSELVSLLKEAGFHLRKWTTNCWPLLLSLPEGQRALSPVEFEESSLIKVLGLQWCPSKDCFSYKVGLNKSIVCTKRRVLSESSRIFDPIGFLAPVIIGIKIIFQDLWREKLKWDDELPMSYAQRWQNIRSELNILEGINVPRILWNNREKIEFHAFCDASLDAYAAVIYCKSVDVDGSVNISLVTAKSKVAPIKVLSLPRLELCGALLLVILVNKLKKSLQLNDIKLYAWTDSAIFLHWMSAPPKKWSVFVANRTSEILTSIPYECWSHVRSTDNPADSATRGISPSLLVIDEIWWKGPAWLSKEPNQWPLSDPCLTTVSSQSLEERSNAKMQVFVSEVNTIDPFNEVLTRSSNWIRSVRVAAYIIRFISNTRSEKTLRSYSALTTLEISNAKIRLLKCAQLSMFASEIESVRNRGELRNGQKLNSLTPFIDSNGIFRVGGRLHESDLSYSAKHPIILNKTHPISRLIVEYTHKKHLHVGITQLLALIKQNYYILGSRNLVRDVVYKCIICFRQRKAASTQLMGNLPAERIRFSRPFSKVGCDYAGPITLRVSRGRNPRFVKSYIAVFVCFVTKGIHLELVGDLTSTAFLMALDRFVSRRGKPIEIWSDNATNFHGARRLLNELYDSFHSQKHNQIVADHLSKDNIAWRFIPPSSPHFGGLWEAGVKSVKKHLSRVIGENKLTYEEMYTLLSQIEALLNSRPMWSNPDGEPSALTPSHFMIGEPYTAIPNPEFLKSNYSLKTNWYFLQTLMQGFWKRWHQEYLTSLQHRPKWQNSQPNIKIDDIVLIKEPNMPPSKWLLGRIINIHPGRDRKHRVVTVKTQVGEYVRPIVKIAPLPLAERSASLSGGAVCS